MSFDWDRFLTDAVTTPTGKRWLENAGDWADKKIQPFSLGEARDFVVREERKDDCAIDPRKIVGTSHAKYNQGMTWRQLLGAGKKIATKLDVLELRPEYYDDPLAFDNDPNNKYGNPDGWHLAEIGNDLFITEGNHRSVIAKFRAHEDGVTSQRVYSVLSLTISEDAMRAYERLQAAYLPGERDSGPERRLISDANGVKVYQIRVRCGLHVFGGAPLKDMEVHEAAEFVSNRNLLRKKVFDFIPNLYQKVFS